MIKANELRIGNRLIHEGQTITVEAIGFDAIAINKTFPYRFVKYGELEPIPITEELLVRIETKHDWFIEAMRHGYLIITIAGRNLAIGLKYLHVAQNVHRFITGEELTFKD